MSRGGRPLFAVASPAGLSVDGGVERFAALITDVISGAGWSAARVVPSTRPLVWRRRLGLEPWVRAHSIAQRIPDNVDAVVSNGFLGALIPRRYPRVHVLHGTMAGRIIECERAALAASWRPSQPPGLSVRDRLIRLTSFGLAEARSSRRAGVVAVSASTAAEAKRYYGVHADAVIPNGVDLGIFRPLEREEARIRAGIPVDARIALFVGRPEWGKGADLVESACCASGYQLWLAGGSSLPGATSLGALDPVALNWAYNVADCVILPTRYEACSYVVLEAMAAGVPILTTNVGWTREFVQRTPEAAPLIVQPTSRSLIDGLARAESGELEAAAAAAHAHVVAHNSLEAFGARWRDFLTAFSEGL